MKKNYFILKLIVIIVIASICSIFLIRILSDKIGPVYLDIAEKEVRKLVILVINNSVNEEVINEIDSNELFSIVKNNNDEIVLIDYNSVNVNKYLSLVVKKVSNNLDLIDEKEFFYSNIDKIEDLSEEVQYLIVNRGLYLYSKERFRYIRLNVDYNSGFETDMNKVKEAREVAWP